MTDDRHVRDSPGGTHRSLWLETTETTDYGTLDDDVHVETAIVGGGIVGVTTAFNLVEAGQSVALIERDRVLEKVTGHTTAKLTSQHGLVYDYLLDHFGEANARQYAEANEAAIDDVEANVRDRGIDCEFVRGPAYTYVESNEDRGDVRREVNAARRLGLPASYSESPPLPFEVDCAVRFDDQAHFHPRKYLLGLAEEIPGDGSYVFENTAAIDIDDGEPCTVSTTGGEILADDVVVATHFPFFDHALYFARLSPKRSYVLAVRLEETVPDGMFYRPTDPYFSVRPVPSADAPVALVGGQSHRTGHGGSTAERYRALERQARDRFDLASVEYRWSTQDYVSIDRVPFVGKHSPQVSHVYVATGFGGWGMSNGTAAARILADRILGRKNPWTDVYRPTRFTFRASTSRFIEHNQHAMHHFFEDRFGKPSGSDVSGLDPGEATIVRRGRDPVGVSRDEDGELHAVSAVCTHMGCLLEWNDGERSWDCPCHGSRFDDEGVVLETPAVEDLDQFDAEIGGSTRHDASDTGSPSE